MIPIHYRTPEGPQTWTLLDNERRMWDVGEWVKITCKPGNMVYRGILQEIRDDYLVINGCGFPVEDIIKIEEDQ